MTILYKFLTRDEDIELTMKASQIIEHYGIQNQMDKLKEECAELIAAVIRCDIADDSGGVNQELLDHAYEETADVILVLEQIVGAMSAKAGRKLAQIAMAKADRQLKRIEEEKHD